MKTPTLFFYFLLPFTAILFWGCPYPKPAPVIEIKSEIKDNMVFQTGTYWIYIDTLTDEIDSVYVIRSKDSVVSEDEIFGYCTFTRNNMEVKSTYYNQLMRQGLVLFCPGPNSPYTYINSILTVSYFCGSYEKNGIESPIVFGDSMAYTHYDTSYVSYPLLGKTYQNVKVFSITSVMGNQTLVPQKAYYSPHFGAIRKEMWDGKKWLLLRYHIVQ